MHKTRLLIVISFCLSLVSLSLWVLIDGFDSDYAKYSLLILPVFGIVLCWLYDFNYIVSLLFVAFPYSRGFFQFEIANVTFSPFSFGCLLIGFYLFIKFLTGNAKLKITAFDFVYIALIAFYTITTMTAHNFSKTGYLYLHGLIIPFICYYIVRLSNFNADQLYGLWSHFTFSALVFMSLFVVYSLASPGRSLFLRMTPIDIATLSYAFVSYYYFNKGKKFGRFFLFISIIALILTFSRTYIVCLVLLPLFKRYLTSRNAVFLTHCFFIVSLLFTVIVSVQVDVNIMDSVSKDEYVANEKNQGRLYSADNWKRAFLGRFRSFAFALEDIKENPMLGAGLDFGNKSSTHNFHLEWLQSSGIVGYVLFYLLFILFFRRLSPFLNTDPFAKCIYVTIIVVFINGLMNGVLHGIMPKLNMILMGAGYSWVAQLKLQNEEG